MQGPSYAVGVAALQALQTELSDVQRQLARVTSSVMGMPSWIEPTLEAPWVNIGAAPANEPAGYLKDALGRVHLRGRIKGGTSGSLVFTLPPKYRPGASNGLYVCAGFNGTTATAAFLVPTVTGQFTVFFAAGTTEIGLGTVSFLAEN